MPEHEIREVTMLSYPITQDVLRHHDREAERLPPWLCASIIGALSILLWAGIGVLAAHLM